ncbi:MAG: 2-oxo acid dehydrogenase subunit E2 [Acutalibacteraceae bacterium]|nr:2-oxo acid dehydrogenase subunit E2 [Acutalibacteraceae bacterium]
MRADGKIVKSDDAEYAVVPHIMVERNDALNFIELDIPAEPMQRYLNDKRKEGIVLSHLSLVIAAYARIVGEFPLLNRFIVNRKIYARRELAVSMVVLKAGADNGTMSKIKLDPADTVFEVNDKINAYVNTNREKGDNNKTDKLVSTLLRIPGLLNIGVRIFKFMDKHGLLPYSIVDASPFHASMGITNLASIRTNHIFHHIYNFGTTSVFLAMGNSREVAKRKADGEIEFVKCIPFGCVMDERICSGYYFAKAFRQFRKYLEHPELLEVRNEAAIKEVPYREDSKKKNAK